jgi:hypothetical protein
MNEEKMNVVAELLATVKASQETSDMSWSTENILISLLRELQVA